MNEFLFPAFQNGIAVFVGLFVLWSFMKFATRSSGPSMPPSPVWCRRWHIM
ncbi:hypothetical protein U5922_016410 [Aquicoccus sp. G2-2]|uniref:hypothetical protein n=1 Tax=Aquicoccus sp. G2-2 TaxID=3092120 RepID=UPI00366D44DE